MEKPVPLLLAQWSLLVSSWISKASHKNGQSLSASFPLQTSTHLFAHTALATVHQPLFDAHISLSFHSPIWTWKALREFRPHCGEICYGTLNIDRGQDKEPAVELECPRIWVCKVFKKGSCYWWMSYVSLKDAVFLGGSHCSISKIKL